jgi:aminoglycoside phosphotransferase (APT) family kinase protein
LVFGMSTRATLHVIAAEILRERHGATGAVTVHETWGASIVVETDNLLLKSNGDRSTVAEELVLRRVREAGVPAPEVIDRGTDSRLPGGRWIVMRRMPGAGFAPREATEVQVATTIGDVAHHLTTVRDVRLPGWGRVGEDGRGASESWPAWLRHFVDEAIAQLHGRVPASVAAAAHRAIDDIPAPAQGSILHGDLALSHLLVDPRTGQVTGIIDWADAIIGDPLYDVATFSMGGPAGDQIVEEMLQPRMIAAYGAGADDPRIRLYRALSHLDNAAWSIANGITSWTDGLCHAARRLLDETSRPAGA